MVGGPAHAYTLLPPLEALANVEETVVREKAVEALTRVGGELPPAHLEQYFLPLIKNLAAGEWFASRASACGLVSTLSARAGEGAKAECRAVFAKLCEDDTPMVRRVAAGSLGDLAATCSADVAKAELLPLFNTLINDEHDSVRLLAVGAVLALAKVLAHDDVVATLVAPLHAASKDRSWRVRHAVAEKFGVLQDALGADLSRSELVPLYSRLLQDQEPEVRTQAALRLPEFGRDFDAADRQAILVTNIRPFLEDLCADSSQHVRVAVASVLVALAPLLGRDASLSVLVPLFIKLLKDDQSEVRLNVVGKLDVLQEVIGVDQIAAKVLPEILHLAEDPQWRVRLAMVEQMPLLGQSLGQEQFNKALTPVCIRWLQDSIFAVRDAAAEHLRQLVVVFGSGWTKSTLLPLLKNLGSERAYIGRLSSLLTLTGVASLLDGDGAVSVLPVVLKLADDKVPNVRFSAARVLEKLIPRLDKASVKSSVRPVLDRLAADPDADVKFHAQLAIAVC
jgi:serine/threonine-protein phosphatase 2A regulatory subunit A